jgi:hypothetical protein
MSNPSAIKHAARLSLEKLRQHLGVTYPLIKVKDRLQSSVAARGRSSSRSSRQTTHHFASANEFGGEAGGASSFEAEHRFLDRKPRAASATQGYRLSAAQTVSSSGFTSFGFLVSGFGRSGCGLGRGRSITDFGSSPVRAFFIAHCEKNRSS